MENDRHPASAALLWRSARRVPERLAPILYYQGPDHPECRDSGRVSLILHGEGAKEAGDAAQQILAEDGVIALPDRESRSNCYILRCASLSLGIRALLQLRSDISQPIVSLSANDATSMGQIPKGFLHGPAPRISSNALRRFARDRYRSPVVIDVSFVKTKRPNLVQEAELTSTPGGYVSPLYFKALATGIDDGTVGDVQSRSVLLSGLYERELSTESLRERLIGFPSALPPGCWRVGVNLVFCGAFVTSDDWWLLDGVTRRPLPIRPFAIRGQVMFMNPVGLHQSHLIASENAKLTWLELALHVALKPGVSFSTAIPRPWQRLRFSGRSWQDKIDLEKLDRVLLAGPEHAALGLVEEGKQLPLCPAGIDAFNRGWPSKSSPDRLSKAKDFLTGLERASEACPGCGRCVEILGAALPSLRPRLVPINREKIIVEYETDFDVSRQRPGSLTNNSGSWKVSLNDEDVASLVHVEDVESLNGPWPSALWENVDATSSTGQAKFDEADAEDEAAMGDANIQANGRCSNSGRFNDSVMMSRLRASRLIPFGVSFSATRADIRGEIMTRQKIMELRKERTERSMSDLKQALPEAAKEQLSRAQAEFLKYLDAITDVANVRVVPHHVSFRDLENFTVAVEERFESNV